MADFSSATVAQLENAIEEGAWRRDGALHATLLLRANALAAAAPNRDFSLRAGYDFYFGGDTVDEIPDDVADAFFTQTGGATVDRHCDISEVRPRVFATFQFQGSQTKKFFRLTTSA